MTIDDRLKELGIELPQAAAPVASYVPVVTLGSLAHVSGQLPFIDGELVTGRLGEDVEIELGIVELNLDLDFRIKDQELVDAGR